MSQEFENILSRELQIEQEKQLFGGSIYAMAHKLPTIYITKHTNEFTEDTDNLPNLESFINYTKLVKNISESCGSDLSLLFAELYKLYEIDINDPNFNDQTLSLNKMIIDFCTESIAHLSLALKQSEKLLERISSYEDIGDSKIEISGNDYCFIAMILNNLFYYYSTIINFIVKKRYLNTEFISSISERLAFIISNEFESIRRMFKVVECYKAIEEKPTFH